MSSSKIKHVTQRRRDQKTIFTKSVLSSVKKTQCSCFEMIVRKVILKKLNLAQSYELII